MKQESNWIGFVQDFGDVVGGVLLGYAIADNLLGHGIFGTMLILASVYLRFYHKKL